MKKVKKKHNAKVERSFLGLLILSLLLIVSYKSYISSVLKTEYQHIVQLCEERLTEKYTYDVTTVATSTLGEEYGYQMLSRGVTGPDFALEYIINEGQETKYILNLAIGGVYFINDGILEDEYGNIMDVNVGFSATEHPQGTWYMAIKQAGENLDKYKIKKKTDSDGTHYIVVTKDIDQIGKHLGYTIDTEDTLKSLKIDVVLKNDKIIKVVTTLQIEHFHSHSHEGITGTVAGYAAQTIVENHVQTVTNFEAYKQEKTLEDYNLTIENEKIVIADDSIFTEQPILVNDAPFGAASVGLNTDNGYILIGTVLDTDFIDEFMASATQINETSDDDVDDLLMARIDYNKKEYAEVYFSRNTHLLLGVRYHGDFVTTTLRSGLSFEQVDKYRIAAGFKRYKEYEQPSTLLYVGDLGKIPYIIEVKFSEDKVSDIGILPFAFYQSEQEALNQITSEQIASGSTDTSSENTTEDTTEDTTESNETSN